MTSRAGLNIANGNMYPWADYTWNPLGGKCPHDCLYCYMKSPPACLSPKYEGDARLEKSLNANLKSLPLNRREPLSFVGDSPVIFVCSGNDFGAAPVEMRREILAACNEATENTYLIQSKNPGGIREVQEDLPPNFIIGTTLETDKTELASSISEAPVPLIRAKVLGEFSAMGVRTMVSVEPIMSFNLSAFVAIIRMCNPEFVSIGADSKNHSLLEPPKIEITSLKGELEEFTKVRIKGNMKRLLGEEGIEYGC